MLVCAYHSIDDNEEAIRLDNLAQKTNENQSVTEEERIKSRKQRAPPQDYEELKKCLATYAVQNYARCGSLCPFCKSFLKLENEYVEAARKQFTPILCRKIVWAINEAMVEYFSTKLS